MSDLIRNFFTNQSSTKSTMQTTSSQKMTKSGQKTMEVTPEIIPSALIKVVGIGGGGGNAVNRMIISRVEGVDFISVNTDAQALFNSQVEQKVNIGKASTRGLGAGSSPEIGKKAAEENSEEIKSLLEGADMVFLTCGMGGGTGTGATPVLAEVARSLGILTVAVVTKPFSFEGARRKSNALEGIDNLRSKVDSLIVIPNDKILNIIDKKTPLTDAFMVVDDVLRQAIQGISDLVTVNGLINVDFADVRAIMQNSGPSLMGIGYGSGENRAVEAARAAIDSPLLEVAINGAKGVIFNVTGGNDLSMFEVDEAAKIVTEAADPDANIIFGSVINENYTGEIKCTVIATGFDEASQEKIIENKSPFARASATSNPGMGTSMTTKAGINVSRQHKPKMEDDLEVPAFMRRPISKNSLKLDSLDSKPVQKPEINNPSIPPSSSSDFSQAA